MCVLLFVYILLAIFNPPLIYDLEPQYIFVSMRELTPMESSSER